MYEGLHDEGGWNPFGKHCGDNIPPVTWTSSNILTVYFVSDYLMNKRGFSAIYTHEDSTFVKFLLYFSMSSEIETNNLAFFPVKLLHKISQF